MTSRWSPATDNAAFGETEIDREERRQILASEREAAVREPGPSWREWLYQQAFRWWLGLGLLIVDTWIAAGWVEVGGWLPLAGSLAVALYLEYLLYQYLWHPFDIELGNRFRPTWRTPFRVGRWSTDREKLLRGEIGHAAPGAQDGPDPHEFL